MRPVYRCVLTALFLASLGCGNQADGPGGGGAPGKADAIDDVAEALGMGETVTGKVEADGQQGDSRLYTLDLLMGDRVVIEMKTKRNSLKPDFILYQNGISRIHSASHELEGEDLEIGIKVLRKEYVSSAPGRYVLVVRAYEGRGSGSYSLSLTCKGGPCNGEYPDPQAFEASEAETCISAARECAFRKLSTETAAPDNARARQLFDGCLGEVSLPEGYGCQTACQFTAGAGYSANAATELCDSIVDSLVFYYDKSSNCLFELKECLDTCLDLNYGYSSDDMASTGLYTCLLGGFNGTCDSYARGHEHCGGTEYKTNSWMACCEFVSATDGAWSDDMDTFCEDSCNDEYCEDAEDSCRTRCSDDDGCFNGCMDEEAWACVF